jgi:hypothetical protein
MGLKSFFLAHEEPTLGSGRLKLTDGRLCEELEIKSLMRSSPLTNSSASSYPKQNGNGPKQQPNIYDYGEYTIKFMVYAEIRR